MNGSDKPSHHGAEGLTCHIEVVVDGPEKEALKSLQLGEADLEAAAELSHEPWQILVIGHFEGYNGADAENSEEVDVCKGLVSHKEVFAHKYDGCHHYFIITIGKYLSDI